MSKVVVSFGTEPIRSKLVILSPFSFVLVIWARISYLSITSASFDAVQLRVNDLSVRFTALRLVTAAGEV